MAECEEAFVLNTRTQECELCPATTQSQFVKGFNAASPRDNCTHCEPCEPLPANARLNEQGDKFDCMRECQANFVPMDAHVLHYPPPLREQLGNRYCSNKQQQWTQGACGWYLFTKTSIISKRYKYYATVDSLCKISVAPLFLCLFAMLPRGLPERDKQDITWEVALRQQVAVQACRWIPRPGPCVPRPREMMLFIGT